ncbi:MAG TPA: hypothetical protein VN641_19625 [Urbifossiella sp.]|nr:hypothetical protein [Urbifossiella sp.]
MLGAICSIALVAFPLEPVQKPKPQPFAISELSEATLTISEDAFKPIRIEPVRTAAGWRIRLTASGLKLEATGMVIKAGNKVITYRINKDGTIDISSETAAPK